jgi:hypothetical protein
MARHSMTNGHHGRRVALRGYVGGTRRSCGVVMRDSLNDPVTSNNARQLGFIDSRTYRSASTAHRPVKSLFNDRFDVDQNLPVSPTATAAVHWSDGRTAVLRMVSANDAFAAAPHAALGSCDCPRFRITDAALGSGVVETTRGPVTVPMWEYRVEGTTARLTRPAVALPSPSMTPPPWNSPAGLQADTVRGSVGGQTLTVTFVGARDGADKPCGVDYALEAVESVTAVVVVIHERRHAGSETCSMMGYPREGSVALGAPLGERTVLDGRTESPLSTIRMPWVPVGRARTGAPSAALPTGVAKFLTESGAHRSLGHVCSHGVRCSAYPQSLRSCATGMAPHPRVRRLAPLGPAADGCLRPRSRDDASNVRIRLAISPGRQWRFSLPTRRVQPRPAEPPPRAPVLGVRWNGDVSFPDRGVPVRCDPVRMSAGWCSPT